MKLDMSSNKMSENGKYALFLLGAILLLVFVILQIVLPLRADIQKNEQTLTLSQQRLASYQSFAGQNKDYAAFAAKQEEYMAEAREALPDTVTIPELVKEYSDLTKAEGISFKSVEPPAANTLKQVNGAYEVPLNISISGNYYKIVDFLQKVENGIRFAKLNEVSITTANNDKNKNTGDLDMTAKFAVYSMKNVLGNKANSKSGEKTGLERVKERDAANMAAYNEGKK